MADDDPRVRRAQASARAVALVVDLALISAAALLVSVVLPSSLVLSTADVPVATRSAGAAWLQTAVVLSLSFAYVVGSWTRWGATIGDRIAGVRRWSSDGSPVRVRGAALAWVLVVAPPSLATAIGTAVPLVGGAVWLVVLCWYLTLAVTCRSRRTSGALHDRWTAIVVTGRDRSRAPAEAPNHTPRPATS